MNKEVGSRDFPIWLLGDSNPKQWEDTLEVPLDPRHPARHSIWTPVLDVIQDRVYRQARLRVDTTELYVRNAIENPEYKPLGNQRIWSDTVLTEIVEFRNVVQEYQPKMVLCFGAFSYEFGRRVMGESPEYGHSYWGARRLGEEFRAKTVDFNINTTNIFPMLHVSIARGKFIEAHEYFCDQKDANYFEYLGTEIADLLLRHRDRLYIWIS